MGLIDDLLPHSNSRGNKRGANATENGATPAPPAAEIAAAPPPPTPAPEPAPPLSPPAARKPRTHKREIVFGVILAVAAAIAITWWATSSREPKPTFLQEPSPTTVFGGTNGTTISGGDSGAAAHQTLLETYGVVHDTYVESGSYEAISLQTLAAKLPGVTIQDGAASSTNTSVVSLMVPSTDRVVLAVRDDAGCAWLRDFGAGPQFVRHTEVVVSCSAAAAPTTGWSGA